MSVALLVFTAVCVVNPFRVRVAVPAEDSRRIAALGAALAWVGATVLALVAALLLGTDAFPASTVRMALGVVLVLQGGWTLVGRLPTPEPRLPGLQAALVPVAFPVTLTPGLGLFAASAALDQPVPLALGVLAAVLALVPALTWAWSSEEATSGRVLGGLARVLAGGLVLAGVALIVNGVYDL
jgi:small neutral amino acid transporter SnatA (MarC family)